MEGISLERIWEDQDFFEIEIIAESRLVSARCKCYVNNQAIEHLAKQLVCFPNGPGEAFLWENGSKGDTSLPFVSLGFSCEDCAGHILIEVFMEIDDGGSLEKHTCCFYIHTVVGQLNEFGSSLFLLLKNGVGTKITLGIVS